MFNISVLLVLLYTYFTPLFIGLLLTIPMYISSIFCNNYIACKIKNIFYTSIGFILHYFFQSEFYTNDNSIIKKMFNEKKQIIVIQNHLSEIDTMYYHSLFDNNIYDYYNSISLMKKQIAYQAIGIGIINFFGGDIFLSRNIVRDSFNINNISKSNNVIYFFPEGTTFCTETKNKSNAFCKLQKLPIYKYVLYPRITGLEMIIKNNNINQIYDLTCIFDNMSIKKYGENFSLGYFLNNRFPKKILINIKKFNINSKNINKQAEDIFKYKNNLIENFNGDFNKYQKIKYNYTEGIYSFIIQLLLSSLSIYLYSQFIFIRYLYLIQIIIFILYLHIFY